MLKRLILQPGHQYDFTWCQYSLLFLCQQEKIEERKAMKTTEAITSIIKKEFPPNQLFLILEVIANDKETDEEVELPYIKFRFR